MIVSDVKTRVKRQFGDEAGVQVTDADILRWINDGQRQIALHNESILEKVATQNSTASEEEYSLPSDLLLLHSVTYKTPDEGSYHHLKGLKKQEFDNFIDGYDGTDYGTGTPTVYTIFASKLILFPTPDIASTNGIKIFFTRKPTDRTADGDTLDVPELYHESIVNYCLRQAYEMDEDWQASNIKASEIKDDLTILRDRDDWSKREFYPSISVLPEDAY